MARRDPQRTAIETPRDRVFEHGVTVGCAPDDDANRRFCPHAPSTRTQISAFLYRYTGASHAPRRSFADVNPSSYYAPAVAWMNTHAITTGCADDSFCPHRLATRAHAATFIHRIATRPDSWGTNQSNPQTTILNLTGY